MYLVLSAFTASPISFVATTKASAFSLTVCALTTLTNQNSIQEEIKSRLRSGNACYNLVQNLFSSSFLSKN